MGEALADANVRRDSGEANMSDQIEAQPAVQQQTPSEVEFTERIKAYLAIAFMGIFGAIVVIWTFHAPQLPGDVAGLIIGAMTTILGSIGGYYWAGTVSKKKE